MYSITLQKYKKISIIARNGHFFTMPVILIPNYYKICIYSFFKGNGISMVTKRHIYGHEMAYLWSRNGMFMLEKRRFSGSKTTYL